MDFAKVLYEVHIQNVRF